MVGGGFPETVSDKSSAVDTGIFGGGKGKLREFVINEKHLFSIQKM